MFELIFSIINVDSAYGALTATFPQHKGEFLYKLLLAKTRLGGAGYHIERFLNVELLRRVYTVYTAINGNRKHIVNDVFLYT